MRSPFPPFFEYHKKSMKILLSNPLGLMGLIHWFDTEIQLLIRSQSTRLKVDACIVVNIGDMNDSSDRLTKNREG